MKYLILFSLILTSCSPSSRTCTDKIVGMVGGCDRNGRCGVQYTDLTSGTQSHPAPGMVFTVCDYKKDSK